MAMTVASTDESSSKKNIRISVSKPLVRPDDVRWLFHMVMALYFVRVVVWHISSESAERGTRQLFGGYYRYMTICFFTVQTFQLIASTLVDMTPTGIKLRMKRNTDDLACAVFVLANLVTLLFHVIEFIQPGGIVNTANPIAWINFATHILNSLVAWTDIAISHPRRFSKRSFGILLGLAISYGCWMSFIKHKTGTYPYGFLNKMPYPQGFLIMAAISATLFAILFFIGRCFSSMTRSIMISDKVEDFDALDMKTKITEKLADQEEVDKLKLN